MSKQKQSKQAKDALAQTVHTDRAARQSTTGRTQANQ